MATLDSRRALSQDCFLLLLQAGLSTGGWSQRRLMSGSLITAENLASPGAPSAMRFSPPQCGTLTLVRCTPCDRKPMPRGCSRSKDIVAPIVLLAVVIG